MNPIEIPKTNIDLRRCKTIECPNCKTWIWKQGVILKEVPGLLIGSAKNGITNVGILYCAGCGDIHPDQLSQIQEPAPDTN